MSRPSKGSQAIVSGRSPVIIMDQHWHALRIGVGPALSAVGHIHLRSGQQQ